MVLLQVTTICKHDWTISDSNTLAMSVLRLFQIYISFYYILCSTSLPFVQPVGASLHPLFSTFPLRT